MTKIGKKYNCNSGTIYFFLKSKNIETRRHKNFDGNINDYENEIIHLFNSGYSANKISKQLKISLSTICRKLNSIGFKLNCSFNKNNLLVNKLEQIINMFNDGFNIKQISKIVKHSESSIWTLLNKNNIDTSKYKIKYTLDETFFEKIDTWEKAYILGWWYSDGNVMKSGKCRISVQESDKKILEEIKSILNYTGELQIINKKNKKHQNMICLCIDRAKIRDDLMRLGCVPNKSLILKFPTEKQVPKYLLPAFILGIFDGDGSISINYNDIRYCGITGTKDFCESLDVYLKEFDINSTNFYLRRKNKVTGSLMFCKKKECIAFLNHIYKDAKLCLKRKYDKYAKVIN